MSNNVTLPNGQIVLTEDVGGGLELPATKLYTGAAGVSGGPVSPANPLPVQEQSVPITGAALPAGGTGSIGWQSAIWKLLGGFLSMRLTDGATGVQATVAAFHNADNQSLPANSYGLNTGGVAQLLNPSGNLDRQRATGSDGITSLGVATGTAQLAGATQSITITPNITANANNQTVAYTASGLTLIPGDSVTIDTGTSKEVVTVGAGSTSSLLVATFTKNHTPSTPGSFNRYNQARDATVPDGSAGLGFAAGATYLYNTFTTGWEKERSASGELDAASGFGTAVAAEYEWNGMGYDRARSLPAKSMNSGTMVAAYAAGATQIVLNAAPAGLTPGEYLYITDTAGGPITDSPQVSASYVIGSVTVPLTTPLLASHVINAVSTWEANTINGPGLSGFYATGIGIEEEALYDPVSGKYYIERAATQDSMPPQNIVAEGEALWNGTSYDRARCDPNATGVQRATTGGASTVSVAAGAAGNTVVKASAGRLARILTTTANGAAAVAVYDNASAATGTIIGYIPASAPAGTLVDFSMPAALGITVGGSSTNPAMTVSFY